MKQDGSILIVDDDLDILTAAKLLLKRRFTNVTICNHPEQIPNLLNEQSFDVILLDMNFGPGESSGEQGFYWLEKILKLKPGSIVIMITAHGGVDIAVEAMKLGATDFIAKPWQNEKVIATLSTAIKLGKTRNEAETLKQANQALIQANNQTSQQLMLGNSPAFLQVRSLIERSAPTEANVLILGENGTGKELVARELHQQSKRAEQVFMSVDLGAVSETLFDSELFGHKKGAFTGAHQDRIGRLLAADGGTLFLDEIGNLPLHLQAKLLTVLEQRKLTPVGGNKAVAIDVRVICATNLTKQQLLDDSIFRQDLLFRLNTVEIELPPLRERTQDIAPIAKHFVELYQKKYHKDPLTLSKSALSALEQDNWPGNIRALRHAIERAVVLAQSSVIQEEDLQLSSGTVRRTVIEQGAAPQANVTTEHQLTGHASDELNLEKIEKHTISLALRKHKYNISHTAKELGLTRAALYRRMEKHGL